VTRPRKRPLTPHEQWERRAPTTSELMCLWRELLAEHDRLTPDLYQGLYRLLVWELRKPEGPWSRERKQATRWVAVYMSIDRGLKPKAAFDFAVTWLADTPARCGREMMRQDFFAMQRKLGRRRVV
jgi:hypothetical protein